ncbi:MAG: hypothetical protein J6Y02_12615 [Pseudobutyrivibrio sp.]|nr:hypothetical protein [Pseudobutyrivibrio sp.]
MKCYGDTKEVTKMYKREQNSDKANNDISTNKKTFTVELSDELYSYVETQAKLRNETLAAYVKRLILIDFTEDQLAVLKYKPMIDRL